MAINPEVFASLLQEGFYDKHPDLYIADRPGGNDIELLKKRLKKLGKDSLLTPNSIFVFGKSRMDIPVESEFNVLFTHEAPSKSIEVTATLKYANEHPNYESTVVPKGYTGVICLIEFKDKIPKEINELSIYRQQKWDKTKAIYLSQKPILDRILELTKEVKP
jgi:hypothetical protein